MPFSPPNIELEAIARTPVEASREVNCAYFGNIGRNSGGFLLPIFFVDQPNVQGVPLKSTPLIFSKCQIWEKMAESQSRPPKIFLSVRFVNQIC